MDMDLDMNTNTRQMYIYMYINIKIYENSYMDIVHVYFIYIMYMYRKMYMKMYMNTFINMYMNKYMTHGGGASYFLKYTYSTPLAI